MGWTSPGAATSWELSAPIGDAMRASKEAFATANGAPFFAWMADHPERGREFDGAMAAGGRMRGLALVATIDGADSRRVGDVGRGDGSLLHILLSSQPHLKGILVDLPGVVTSAAPAERLDIQGGDAFTQLPTNCDTYLFVNVIHDWGDDDAVRLLGRAGTDGRRKAWIVVVEGHLTGRPADIITTRTDLSMLALAPGGRERTAKEIARLGERAELHFNRSIPPASADFAHVFTI